MDYKAYPWRFAVLGAFCLFSFAESVAWFTYAGFPGSTQAFYGISAASISIYLLIGPLVSMVALFPTIWILDKCGLRLALILAGALILLSSSLRLISVSVGGWTLSLIAQAVGSAGGPAAMASAPKISALWFPPHQRSAATAIGVVSNSMGITLGFLLGLMCDPTSGACVPKQLYLQLGLSAISLLCLFLFVVDAPPTPSSPATDRSVAQIKIWPSVRALLSDRHFVLLCLASGCSAGIFQTWTALLDLVLTSEGATLSAWLGFGSNLAVIVGGICVGLAGGYWKLHYKAMIVILFFSSAAMFGIFNLLFLDVIPKSSAALGVTLVLGSLLGGAVNPLFYELSVETGYPAGEGLIGNIVGLPNNFFGAILYPLQAVLSANAVNWINFGNALVFGAVMLFLFKESYRRAVKDGVIEDADTRPILINNHFATKELN